MGTFEFEVSVDDVHFCVEVLYCKGEFLENPLY